MAARIPPKGTEGYRRYWADRYLYERLEQEAKRLEGYVNNPSLPPTATQRSALNQALQFKQHAADLVKKMWEETDYFAFNTQKGTST
jgi:hypothetical protein